jgi:ankyrin repeat protein
VDYNAGGISWGSRASGAAVVEERADDNAQGGHFGNALGVASYGGREPVVRLLLEKGADVKLQDGQDGSIIWRS